MAPEQLLPGPLSVPLGGRLDPRFCEDVGDRSSADLDVQTAQGVSDLGVPPARVLTGDTENQHPDFVRLPGSAGPPDLGAVVLPRDELPEPLQDGGGPYNLAALLALRGR